MIQGLLTSARIVSLADNFRQEGVPQGQPRPQGFSLNWGQGCHRVTIVKHYGLVD